MSNFSMKAVVATTVIGGAIAGALTASAALNLPTQSCAFMFNTNMKLGSRGADVKNLQVVLNAYPQTQVAASGAGSPGMETTSFGPATRRAVIKFQDLHLAELGISKGTGNVFAGTRGLLNEICAGTSSTGNTGSNTGNTNTGNTNTNTSGAVSASLAASQPMGMVVAGQTGAALANINFTGNGSVTKLVLQRTGVSVDASLPNVYLYDGNKRITDAASVTTGGYITFSSPAGLFSVNGSRTITVRADICTITSCGSTIVGQAIGIKLNSLTSGGVESTFTNVMGNYLTVSGVTLATVQLGTIDTTSKTVDAGTLNYNVWSDSISIGTRDTLLRAMTLKYVGSAPIDSVQNLSLYVDGTKVAGPAVVDASNNNKVTFDLGANPFVLKSGSHTVDVRGDIIKGSSFNFYFSIENSADLLVEDSNLAGVAIAATVGDSTTAISTSNTDYGIDGSSPEGINVNSGSVTVNVDPSFSPTTITGGATNMPIAQFTLKGYGENVKVNSLLIKPVLTGATGPGLANVALFLNGGQIGTSQNITATTTGVTYNLGSSLIVEAGQTVTLTVKADIVNPSTSAAYSGGTVTASIGGVSSNAQGVTSNQLVSVAGSVVTDSAITVGSGAGTFARTSGFVNTTVAPNTAAVKIGSFTLQAGSSEDALVNQASVNLVYGGSPLMTSSNISNLTLKTGSTVLGTPVGAVPSSGSSTFSFADITIPMNTTKTFDVYADLGSATSSVYVDMAVTVRGAVSRISTVSSGTGSSGTISPTIATLAAATLVSSSAVNQYVVGGTTFGIGTFKLKTSAGDATVKKLTFAVTGTDAVVEATVNGVTQSVSGSSITFTGLSIPVSTIGTDVPVTVKFSGFKDSTSGGALTAGVSSVKLTLNYVEAQSGAGSTISDSTNVDTGVMSLVASKPTVTVSAGGTDSMNIAALSKLGEFTVTADANGSISMASTSITLSTVGVTSPELATSTLVLKDGNTTITGVSLVANAGATASTTPVFTFTTAYEIAKGTSKTFSVYGTISGTAQQGIVPRVNMSLTSGATFKWNDVIGGGTTYTGAAIYNFPTNSYTSKI